MWNERLKQRLRECGLDVDAPPQDAKTWHDFLVKVNEAWTPSPEGTTASRADEVQALLRNLEAQTSKLQAVIDAVPGPISWVSDELKYLGVNQVLASIFGLEASDFAGKPAGFLSNSRKFEDTITDLFRSPDTHRSWESQVSVKGILHWFLMVAQKYNHGHEAVIVGYDISDRIVAEITLRENEEKFRSTFNQVAVGIANVTLDYKWFQVNQRLCDIIGCEPDELFGEPIDKILHPEDLETYMMNCERLIEGELNNFSLEARLIAGRSRPQPTSAGVRSGSAAHVWVNLTGSVFIGSMGEPNYFINVIEDITPKKLAEAELNATRQALAYSEKMVALGEMAAGIAHEINNPLAIIHGRASQLATIIDAEPINVDSARRVIDNIASTAMRIAKIVKGPRAFSRDGDNDPFARATINAVVEDTLELCKERFYNHGIRLNIKGAERPVEIECQPTQIAQVVLNLLGNAFDAVERLTEKWVDISIVEFPEAVEIWVTDSGDGIPEAIRDKILQPFFTTKEIGKGTGLGLSISKGIIDKHRGSLRIDPSCANTRFIVRLPKRQPEIDILAS